MPKHKQSDDDDFSDDEDYQEYVPLKHRRLEQVRWCSSCDLDSFAGPHHHRLALFFLRTRQCRTRKQFGRCTNQGHELRGRKGANVRGAPLSLPNRSTKPPASAKSPPPMHLQGKKPRRRMPGACSMASSCGVALPLPGACLGVPPGLRALLRLHALEDR